MDPGEITQLTIAEYRQQRDFHRQQAVVYDYMIHELESSDAIVDQNGDVVSYSDFLDL
jgi:hypothetical protein